MKKKIKILLVEDEILIASEIRLILEELQFDLIKPVTDGKTAVTVAESEKPDIILMDMELSGGMNGVEAAGKITARKDIPIIFISGYSIDDIKDRLAGLKPVAILEKPVSAVEIAEIIRTVFNH